MKKVLIITNAKTSDENNNGVSKIICNLKKNFLNYKIEVKSFSYNSESENRIVSVLKYIVSFNGLYRDYKLRDSVLKAKKYLEENHSKYDIIMFMGPEYHSICDSINTSILNKVVFNFIDNSILFKSKIEKVESSLIKKCFYLLEIHKMKKAYNKIKNKNILFVSRRDSLLFNFLSKGTSNYIENGVNVIDHNKKDYTVKDKVKVVFHGDITYIPNIKAVEIINELASNTKISFNVIGKVNNEVISNNLNVNFIGFVDDLYVELSKFDIYICPVFTGAGIKNKILDAAMIGLPIISTREAMCGIKFKSDYHYLEANCNESIEANLKRLLNNIDLRYKLGSNAKLKIESYYQWTSVCNKYEKLFNEIYRNNNSSNKQ